MAAPSAPGNPFVRKGYNAQGARVGCDTAATATTYTFYWSNVTGVSTSVYKGKRISVHNYCDIEGLPFRKVFLVATATNAGGEESVASAETSGFYRD